MNCLAASAFWVPAGIARAQAQSQLALAQAGVRRECEADLVGDGRVVRVGHEGRRNGGVDPHAALALLEQRQVLVEAVGGVARRTRLHSSCSTKKVERILPLRLIELGVPVLVEPAGAERVAVTVMKAPPSPQPALPRRQMPLMSLSRSVIAAAASRMKSQVGASGISRPAFSIRSVRYMTIELSP
jgi:hypothetical protein